MRDKRRERPWQVVYFVRRADQKVKIGTTCDLPKRMKELARRYGDLALLGSVSGGYDLELALHRRLAGQRHRKGEWFHDGPELQSALTDVSVYRTQ